jgi:hypothetical protein
MLAGKNSLSGWWSFRIILPREAILLPDAQYRIPGLK